MTVEHMPAILTDTNGLPRGHYAARDKATQALRDWVNELPESTYHLGLDDAEDVADVMLAVYLTTLK